MSLTRNRIRDIRALGLARARDRAGLFLLEGLRLVGEAASSGCDIPEAFSTASFEASPEGGALMARLRAGGTRCTRVREGELGRIANTVQAQGVVALARIAGHNSADLLEPGSGCRVVLGLDGVADPGNMGSIIRTADWFGAAGVLLGRNSVDPYNPKVVRATMGGLFHLPVVRDTDLAGEARLARERGYALLVAEPGAPVTLEDTAFPSRVLLVLGSEAHGVSEAVRAQADGRIAVRRYGGGESLNVGVTCGVILAEYRRQHRGAS